MILLNLLIIDNKLVYRHIYKYFDLKIGLDMFFINKKNNDDIKTKAYDILHSIYGKNASFREGQYEAIEATLSHKRTLVVQKTGWGKSLIYFVCSKILKAQNKGLTIIISPLLTLMENQIEQATQFNLKCEQLNSSTYERHEEILNGMANNQYDLIFATPETLCKTNIITSLSSGSINIALIVVDEAHCISDWGHDFRLEYTKIKDIITTLPESTHILATTATANNIVINDINEQFGGDTFISRGSLTRKSLNIQTSVFNDDYEKYAFILQHIQSIPGTGIIYCLTKNDCESLSEFLNMHNISARPFYSGLNNDFNNETLSLFKENKIKAIVATIKLAMGFDKGDVSFVINYDIPKNITLCYQEIGRAGRNIDNAYIIILFSNRDIKINNFFIEQAFPTEEDSLDVYNCVKNNNGITKRAIQSLVNIQSGKINKSIDFLEHDGFIYKDNNKYYTAPKTYFYNKEHYNAITKQRYEDLENMKNIINVKTCLSKYIVNKLDDTTAQNCGKCTNCRQKLLFSTNLNEQALREAHNFIDNKYIVIEPRKMWLDGQSNKKIPLINEIGFALTKYNNSFYGDLVKQGKYGDLKGFSDKLLNKVCDVIPKLFAKQKILYITAVPSKNSTLVEDFTKQVAEKLHLKYIKILEKITNTHQKDQQNSSYQCSHARSSFKIIDNIQHPHNYNIILLDDMKDSGWTLTVCGYLLREYGFEKVFPFALADSSNKDD